MSAEELSFWSRFSVTMDKLVLQHSNETGHQIHLSYDLHVVGPIDEILWNSSIQTPANSNKHELRKNELWKNTCFEFFLAPDLEKTSPYLEMNINSSNEWNLYALSAYRENLQEISLSSIKELPLLTIHKKTSEEMLVNIKTSLELPWIGKHMGSTLILESTMGFKSYWALDHCSPQPDFHNKASFKIAF